MIRQGTDKSRARLLALVFVALGVAAMGLPSAASAQGSGGLQGPGRDGLYCNGVKPTWVGTSGDDVYHGTPGDDVIIAGAGNDTIFGGGGHDLICGNDGDDSLSGQAGIDVIYGGAGNDRITGGRSIDMLYGERGNDRLDGGHGPDVLHGAAGDDFIQGGDHNDDLHGGSGNDRLLGGRGANHCNAGVMIANCERRPNRNYLTTGSWTVSDRQSYGQVAWLQYELAKDNVGGPFTGAVSNGMFQRLSGISCDRCVGLSHDQRSATFTARLDHKTQIVIDNQGQPRLVTPRPASPDWAKLNNAKAWIGNTAGRTTPEEQDAVDRVNQANDDAGNARQNLADAEARVGEEMESFDPHGDDSSRMQDALNNSAAASRANAKAQAELADALENLDNVRSGVTPEEEEDSTNPTGGSSGGGTSGGGTSSSGSGRTPGPECGHHC